MRTTEHAAKPTATHKAGRFTTLRTLLFGQGSGALAVLHTHGSGAPIAGQARRLTLATLASFCALLLGLATAAAPASATVTEFGSEGEGAGQFSKPRVIAVDNSNDKMVDESAGDVYIGDEENNRVDKFGPQGEFLLAWGWGVADGKERLETCGPEATPPTSTCEKGGAGAGTGQFETNNRIGIAVNDDSLSASYGDLYVTDKSNSRVEKFTPNGEFVLMFGDEVNKGTKGDVCLAGEECKAGVEGSAAGDFEYPSPGKALAVGPSGIVYVGEENRVQEFSEGGVYEGEIALPGAGYVLELAVDASEHIYVHSEDLSGVRVYDTSGTELGERDPSTKFYSRITLGPSGELFVAEENGHIFEYDSTGKKVSNFIQGAGESLVFGDGVKELYALYEPFVQVASLPPAGPSVLAGSESASEVLPTTATLSATVDPEGPEATTVHFEYGESEAYGSSTSAQVLSVGAFEEQPVSAGLVDLKPATTYHYRIFVHNAAGETAVGPDQTFTTLPAVSIESEFVVQATATSATLTAELNGHDKATEYHFEYGKTVAYGTSIPIPNGLLAAGSTVVTVSAHLQDLSPSGEYHYRVVAGNEYSPTPIDGADRTFTTQPPGSQPVLPDGRQWELVTPPNKHGASITPPSETGPLQAAEDGRGIVYQTNVPPELEPAGYGQQGFYNQVLSTRGPQGWSTRNIAIPRGSPVQPPRVAEYSFFSKDLSLGLVEPLEATPTPLSSEASEATRYIRREALCDVPATASECYLPLLTGKEGFADVPPGTKFGEGSDFEKVGATAFEGATPDLSHVLLGSHVALTSTPIPIHEELYEWSAGVPADEALQLVSVLPANEGGGPTSSVQAKVGSNLLASWSGARHSISNDGSRIFWEQNIDDRGPGLYMRDTVKGETVRLDVPQPGGSGNEYYNAVFQIASSDGSRVFFSDGRGSGAPAAVRLTPQSGKEGQDLYECEIVEEAGKLACKLTDVTPEADGQSAEVQNQVVGASEDGSYLYFVANGVLGDGAEHGARRGTCEYEPYPNGTCNLYEYHDGTTTFIATLSHEDEYAWGRGEEEASIAHGIGFQTARVSPDGRFVAFMSDRSLTGYDNLDANSGKPDMEVYLYDATSGRLACVSCNPTGSRPVGVEVNEFEHLIARTQTHEQDVADIQSHGGAFNLKSWVAANLAESDEVGKGDSDALYQSRSLSDDGRLFFNSEDPLVPQAVNGNEDVYEFEPEGMGSCTASSTTFNGKTGGCVSLISSGTSPEESGFLDASEGGNDVFFMTSAKLVPTDYDDAYDIYDAHVCTTVLPCATAPVSPPPCNSGESCKAAPSPQPQIFGAPSSATFKGTGNVASPSSGPVVKQKSLTRAQKLARALRACQKKPKRARAACVRQARKRYGARAARRAAAGAIRRNRG